MGRDYVTIREEEHNGETVWAETSVGRMNLKSAPAKVTRAEDAYRIIGAAWGAPIAKVEVQIDDGPWTGHDRPRGGGPLGLENLELRLAEPRARRAQGHLPSHRHCGNVQPAMDDPLIAGKKTYWESNGQITRRVMIG